MPHHFAAVSTALDKVAAFGIAADRIFGFWDWVGGRYSVWSAIGLPLMIAVGPATFGQFLAGAHAMDRAFRGGAARRNLPILLGLVGFWHRDVCGYALARDPALRPAAGALSRLPAAARHGIERQERDPSTARAVERRPGPLVWGEPGTNGQHAFFQLMHQGTDVIPVEFIVAAEAHEPELRSTMRC